jgi:hypothetical protein
MASTRTIFFFVRLILINATICLLWWALILERPERAKTLIVLLPLQVAINFLVVSITRKIRISGLTVVFVLGLLFSLFSTFVTREWWMLIFVPLSTGLIAWSVKLHRLTLSKRTMDDGSGE